jgi:lipopolysaccharide transport system permease protein
MEKWTEEITPRVSLFDIRLGEVWRYRDLLFLFVRRDFIATYKQTILGPLWHFIQPVLTTIMFLVVFGRIAKIPTDGIEAIPFYMAGITIWNYFSSCFGGTSNTFLGNASIFGKVYFPRLIMPLSIIISNIIKLAIQFLLLLSVLVYYGITKGHFHFGVSWLLLPILIVMMALMGLGFGVLISSLTTKYRDFTVLIGFGIQLLMYATPIAYPSSYLAEKSKYAYLINYNPLSAIVEGFKFAIFGKGSFQLSDLWYSFICMIVALFLGVITFNKTEKSFMDTV